MFDQMMDTFRKATESTLQCQQQMLHQWTSQWANPWPQPPWASLAGATSTPLADQLLAFQKQAAALVTDVLKKHREVLDHQYAAGIRTLEEAFKVGEARDPAQLMRLTEEFWKHSFECLRTLSEEQMKNLQQVGKKWVDSAAKAGR
ncbi:MAG: hypothetical protein U0794_12935 [Isosphaeraceae bacterium]